VLAGRPRFPRWRPGPGLRPRKHLWVHPVRPRRSGTRPGDFVNQHPGGAGLPDFIGGDRDIDGTDIVLVAHLRADATSPGWRTGR